MAQELLRDFVNEEDFAHRVSWAMRAMVGALHIARRRNLPFEIGEGLDADVLDAHEYKPRKVTITRFRRRDVLRKEGGVRRERGKVVVVGFDVTSSDGKVSGSAEVGVKVEHKRETGEIVFTPLAQYFLVVEGDEGVKEISHSYVFPQHQQIGRDGDGARNYEALKRCVVTAYNYLVDLVAREMRTALEFHPIGD